MEQLKLWSRVLTLVFVYTFTAQARGHGYLKSPKARNVVANSDYCPQCLAAGGPSSVSSGANWPNGKHGVCGDPYSQPQPRNHEAGGKYYGGGASQATYTEGQVIDINVYLTAYHKGDFTFRICKIDGVTVEDESRQLDDACLDEHVLKQADVPGAQRPGEARYFIGPSSNNWDYKLRYQLPKGLTCDGKTSRCVMQWWWVTGNSCDPPNTPAEYGTPSLGVCGTGAYPEEFWNCADITILPSGAFSGSKRSPKPLPLPSPPAKASPSPSPKPKSPELQSTKPAPIASPGEGKSFCRSLKKRKMPYGYYADRSSGCFRYYRCESSGSWLFDCPAGLLFNDKVNVCDWPESVEC